MRGDWKDDAMQYRDVDLAVQARLEAMDAITYFQKRGKWPEGLSVRAWDYLKANHAELDLS